LLRIADVRARAGLQAADASHQAQAQLAAARQQQAAVRGSAAVRKAALAALLGIAPAALPPLQPHPLPKTAAALPADAGLDLIARRPDIAAARWQVQSALHQTDAARARFFPDLSISALAGLSSIDLGKLLTAGSRTFAVGPALHLPIFEGGLLRAGYGVSKARLDAAIAHYNDSVLDAAREVATQSLTVQRLAAQRREQQAQLAAMAALRSSAAARQRQGLTDGSPALQAQAQWLQQRDAAVALEAQALSADVALTRALGGGYRMDTRSAAAAVHPASSPSHRTDSP
jgi:multidrug efflux system outer membrane protein